MSIHSYSGKQPTVGAGVYLAPSAELIGDVTIGEQSSIWFGSVLRGDINRIVIGHHTNIQDLSLGHVADDFACLVGNYVTVGHRVVLHACTIGDEVLVGMGAIVMDGVVVGEQSIIGAGALLTRGLQVPPGSLVYGAPAKVISKLGEKERGEIRYWAEKYCRVAAGYLSVPAAGCAGV
ncbi:MAG: gamma carbonic anhydrase family protein [Verrucomicrobiota bacterium]